MNIDKQMVLSIWCVPEYPVDKYLLSNYQVGTANNYWHEVIILDNTTSVYFQAVQILLEKMDHKQERI